MAAGGGHRQLFPSSDHRASSPTPRHWLASRGRSQLSSTAPMLAQDRCVRETALPCSQLWNWFTHTYANRVNSIVLPRWGAGYALPRIAVASQSCCRNRWVMETSLPCLLLQGWLNHTSTHRIVYTVLLREGAVLAFSSVSAGVGNTGNLPCSSDLRTSSPTWLSHRSVGWGGGESIFPSSMLP